MEKIFASAPCSTCSFFQVLMTFDGRISSMEVDLNMEKYHRWKMTTNGRLPFMKDDIWWKTIFDGKQTLSADKPGSKPAFDRWKPLKDNSLRLNIEHTIHLMVEKYQKLNPFLVRAVKWGGEFIVLTLT